jgi:hypothetical protein
VKLSTLEEHIMIKKSILTIVLITSLSIAINGFFAFNEGCMAFLLGQCPDGESGMSLPKVYAPKIGNLSIVGAGYYLKSHSDMLICLNMIEISELSGLDYDGVRNTLDRAIENMEKARDTYYQLKSLVAVTPYNQEVIDKLLVFDYDGFQTNRGLNAVIFGKVKKLLSNGDVRGVYYLFYEDLVLLFERIKNLKLIVDNERIVEISELWRINQKYSELQLFGQYFSEVFYALR